MKILVLMLALSPLACTGATKNEKVQNTQGAQTQATEAKVKDVLENKQNYQNKEVRLKGSIESFKGARSFVLDGDGILQDEIAVVAKTPLRNVTQKGILEEGKDVEVTGVVRVMNLIDVEKEYSWDWDPQVEFEAEGPFAFVEASEIRVKE